MDLQNKTVLVIGTGKSGIGAAGLLSKAGAKTILFDSNEKLDVEALKEKTAGISSLQIVTGTLPSGLEEQVELLVISPGGIPWWLRRSAVSSWRRSTPLRRRYPRS